VGCVAELSNRYPLGAPTWNEYGVSGPESSTVNRKLNSEGAIPPSHLKCGKDIVLANCNPFVRSSR
jgi:hypothetical protein